MRKVLKKQTGIFIMLLLVLCVLPSVKVSAGGAGLLKNKFNLTLTTCKSDKTGWTYLVKGLEATDTVKISKFKVTSSNKSVVSVKAEEGSIGAFVIKAKKAGTAKITVSGVINNKTVKKTGTVKVVKYENPFQTLKVNGKSYKSKIKNSVNFISISNAAATCKLNYKLKSGWKIVKKGSRAYTLSTGAPEVYSIKNGGSYPVGEYTNLALILQNTKTKAMVEVSITIE